MVFFLGLRIVGPVIAALLLTAMCAAAEAAADPAAAAIEPVVPVVFGWQDAGLDPNPGTSGPIEQGWTDSSALVPEALQAGVAFDTIDSNGCCGGGFLTPPQPDLAVGLQHIVVVVNQALQIYDTAGTSLLGPVTLGTFFSNLSSNCINGYSPVVLFDEAANRFIIGATGSGSSFCAAVSWTGNPIGFWYLYEFPTGAGYTDLIRIGIGRDALYMGAVNFGAGEPKIWAFDLAAMYAGAATLSVTRDLPTNLRYPQPLNLHGTMAGAWPASGPHYFVSSLANPTGSDFGKPTISAWNDPFGANTLTTWPTFNLAANHAVTVATPIPAPQVAGDFIAGSTALNGVFFDFEYGDGFGWIANHVGCNTTGGLVDCIQWAKIDLAGASVADAGVTGSPGIYRVYPDLAVNLNGDMAIGYTRTTTSTHPGVWVTGRLQTDPATTLQQEVLVKAGEVVYSSFDSPPLRWGEYTGMSIAPGGCTFWYVGEYAKNNGNSDTNWGNWVSSFEFPGCTSPAIFADGFESLDTSMWSNVSP